MRLGDNLDPLNPAVNSYLAQAHPGYLQQTGDPVGAQPMAGQSLEDLREQQALALAYFDGFLIFAVVRVILAFMVLLMKRSVVEKGPTSRRNSFGWTSRRPGEKQANEESIARRSQRGNRVGGRKFYRGHLGVWAKQGRNGKGVASRRKRISRVRNKF